MNDTIINNNELRPVYTVTDKTNKSRFKPDNSSLYGINQDQLGKRAKVDPIIQLSKELPTFQPFETMLSTVRRVNMNSVANTNLFRVPNNKRCFVTRVLLTDSSVNLTTASISFGYNASANDVIADGTHTELVDSTVYKLNGSAAGAKTGLPGQVFKVRINTPQGAAATITVYVIGYIVENG